MSSIALRAPALAPERPIAEGAAREGPHAEPLVEPLGDPTSEERPSRDALVGDFGALYDASVDFVHRSVRRLGVPDASVEDVVQEVFVVAFRRRDDFRGESTVRTWLYGIVLRTVRHHRRTTVRAGLHGVLTSSVPEHTREGVAAPSATRPDHATEARDAYRTVLAALDRLDDDKREVFVLAELEEMPIVEIAALYGLKTNTAYSRVRLARAAFDAALAAGGAAAPRAAVNEPEEQP